MLLHLPKCRRSRSVILHELRFLLSADDFRSWADATKISLGRVFVETREVEGGMGEMGVGQNENQPGLPAGQVVSNSEIPANARVVRRRLQRRWKVALRT